MKAWGIAFLWAVAAAVLIAPAARLGFDNDSWLPDAHQQEIYLDYLSDQFAPGDSLVIALDLTGGFFDDRAMARLNRLEAALETALGRHLISMRSPLSATRLVSDRDAIKVESFFDSFKRGQLKDFAAYRRAFAASPYHGRLLSEDAAIAALDLRLDTREQAERRHQVMQIIRAVLADEGWQGRYHLIAEAALKDTLNEQTRSDMARLLSGAVVMLVIFLWLVLGRFISVAFVFLAAALAAFASLSAIVVLGHQMTALALILPIWASVIAVAHSLHIFAHYRHLIKTETRDIAKKTISRVWRPCFFANLTTAIGFGSFMVSELIPLNHLGWDSLLAMLLLYLIVLAAFWSLFHFFGNFAQPAGASALGYFVQALFGFLPSSHDRLSKARLLCGIADGFVSGCWFAARAHGDEFYRGVFQTDEPDQQRFCFGRSPSWRFGRARCDYQA